MGTQDEEGNARITIVMPARVLAQIRARAARMGTTPSALIRMIVLERFEGSSGEELNWRYDKRKDQ